MELHINGKRYTVTVDADALEYIEQHTKVRIMSAKLMPASVEELAHMVSGLLMRENPEVTAEWVAKNMLAAQMREAIEAIQEALTSTDWLPGQLAPFVPSQIEVLEGVIEMAAELAPAVDTFIDCGSGDGRVLMMAQQRLRPDADSGSLRPHFKTIRGYELNPTLASQAGAAGLNVEVADFMTMGASTYTFDGPVVLYAYLFPRASRLIEEYIWPKLPADSVVVVQDFPFTKIMPSKIAQVVDHAIMAYVKVEEIA